jgi:methanogenic corrinoid protein MtbC1
VDAPAVDEFADDFFDALATADEWRAVDVAVGLTAAGTPVEEVLLDLVAPAQERIGLLWQAGAWSIAREHAATCINERVIAAVTAPGATRGRRGHVVLSCVAGEWHSLPARLAAEVLRCAGWRVTFLGASVPSAQLVSYIHEQGPDVLALSSTMAVHLPGTRDTVAAARRAGTRVLAGGPGFGPAGRWAHAIGVDAFAACPVEGAAVLDEQRWNPHPTAAPTAGDAEYVALRDYRDRLVRDAMHALVVSPGVAGDPDNPEPDNVAQIVDALAAAVQLCDREVFGAHLRWLDGFLVERTGSSAGVLAVLDVFAAGLRDFPIALECLSYGRMVLAAAEADR